MDLFVVLANVGRGTISVKNEREKERGREEQRVCVSFTLGGYITSMQYFSNTCIRIKMPYMTSALHYTQLLLLSQVCVWSRFPTLIKNSKYIIVKKD